jgi:N-acetylmuramoyl-L-alanine amidase
MTGAPATPDHSPRHRRSTPARVGRVLVVPLLLGLILSAGAGGVVRVRRGDTLWGLAQRHQTTVAALRHANGMRPNESTIYAGQTLRLPGGGTRAGHPTRTVRRYHTVVRGDTLFKIARRYHRSPEWIARRNHLPPSRIVRLGARLLVGSDRRVVHRSAPARRHPARVPRARVVRLIRAEARRAGIDPSLALGLSYLESGFQQHVVSSAGAVGVMQVMPGTGAWVSRYLVGRRLNLYRVEDNVTAGVRYLALLLRTAGRERTAIAGYYQGLASVRRNGMYKDTKRYVRNVRALQRRFARG